MVNSFFLRHDEVKPYIFVVLNPLRFAVDGVYENENIKINKTITNLVSALPSKIFFALTKSMFV